MGKNLEELIGDLGKLRTDDNYATLESELENNSTLLRESECGKYELRIFDALDSEFLMNYVGLAREVSFREGGGGSGKDRDVDAYDLGTAGVNPFMQLIILEKDENENKNIIGGYRYAEGKDLINANGEVISPTAHLFNMTKEFIDEYLPQSIELGRSFVLPGKIRAKLEGKEPDEIKNNLTIMKNLVKGLGAIMAESEDARYLFGKITMYPDADTKMQQGLFNDYSGYMNKYHSDSKRFLSARPELKVNKNKTYDDIEPIFKEQDLEDPLPKNQRRNVVNLLKNNKGSKGVPPMLSIYQKLSYDLKYYGTALNEGFGKVHESAIMVDTKKLYKEAIKENILSYHKVKPEYNGTDKFTPEKIKKIHQRFNPDSAPSEELSLKELRKIVA